MVDVGKGAISTIVVDNIFLKFRQINLGFNYLILTNIMRPIVTLLLL